MIQHGRMRPKQKKLNEKLDKGKTLHPSIRISSEASEACILYTLPIWVYWVGLVAQKCRSGSGRQKVNAGAFYHSFRTEAIWARLRLGH